MALEALQENIFSTETDIWSFGIVSWEIFTFAQMPYSDVKHSDELIEKLCTGYRLKQPTMSTDEM